MKMLALEREVPGITDDQFTPDLMRSEAKKAWELHTSDVLREMYFSADKHEAVLVMECDSVEDAQRSLSELPLVRAGLIGFDIVPLAPYDGFARLFGS
jgi:muconolactone delta-isomerase